MDKKVKKILLVYVIGIAILVLQCVVFPDRTYTLNTIVVDVNYDADIVSCVDECGNEWQFDGCEDWLVNDVCILTMNDKGTAEIEDDEILEVKYNGWVEQKIVVVKLT